MKLFSCVKKRCSESTNMNETQMKNTQKHFVCREDTQTDRASHKVCLSGFTLTHTNTHTHTPLHTNEGLIQGYYGILVWVKKGFARCCRCMATKAISKQLPPLHWMCYNYYKYHRFYFYCQFLQVSDSCFFLWFVMKRCLMKRAKKDGNNLLIFK